MEVTAWMTAIVYGGNFRMMKKRDLLCNTLCRARCIYVILPMLPATDILEKIQAHPVLQYITLDGVVTFTRLASHLKRDIIQPQSISESNPSIAPTILPQPVTHFLGTSLGISFDVIEEFWDILKDYVWETPVVPLTSGDFQLFKHFGWPCGLS